MMGAAMILAAPAQAVDSTGCGLGSMAWRGQRGIGPQVLAATTNGSFGTQTFGITFGTSGCDPDGRVTGGTGKWFWPLWKTIWNSLPWMPPPAEARPLRL